MFKSVNHQRFRHAYDAYEAGHYTKALEELRDLKKEVIDPWGKAELLYYEVRFLVDMREVVQAKERATELTNLVSSLVEQPTDGDEYNAESALSVMVRHAQIKVAVAERKAREALRFLDDLLRAYPKQLSLLEFRNMFQELQTLRGILLADLGCWQEAKPLLEAASPPPPWRVFHAFYLGQAYYECCEYERAREKLTEALKLGLEKSWESQAHYLLGLIEHYLSDTKAAKQEFELCARIADAKHIDMPNLWAWLEATSRTLGLLSEAEHYRELRAGSLPKKVN